MVRPASEGVRRSLLGAGHAECGSIGEPFKRNGNHIGTAGYGLVCPVVWGPEANYLRLPDWALFSFVVTVSTFPIWTLRTVFAFRIVDPFFVWTAKYLLAHDQ